jgi:uncharacterized cupredoxin-like copper-binding protein
MLQRTAFRLFLVAGLCLLSVGLLTAQEDEAGAEEPFAVYNFSMQEFSFLVEGMEEGAPLQLEAGKLYELHFTNEGALMHELLAGQEALVTDAEHDYHLDFATNLLDDVEVSISGEMNGEPFIIGVAGLVEFELSPGQSLTISFTLPEEKVGEWEIACFSSIDPKATEENPGLTHFDLGMKVPVVVSAPSS